MTDPFLQWWEGYFARLNKEREDRRLPPYPASTKILMIEAARAAWYAGDIHGWGRGVDPGNGFFFIDG